MCWREWSSTTRHTTSVTQSTQPRLHPCGPATDKRPELKLTAPGPHRRFKKMYCKITGFSRCYNMNSFEHVHQGNVRIYSFIRPSQRQSGKDSPPHAAFSRTGNSSTISLALALRSSSWVVLARNFLSPERTCPR